MNFEQARKEYTRLKASYENGEISPEQFEQAVLNLRLVDKEGQAWQIGMTGGAWQRKQGATWVEDTPLDLGGTAIRADRTFFGAPTWLALAIGGGGVLTVLGVFVISMFFLLNSGAFPAGRVITATPGPTQTPATLTALAGSGTKTASLTPNASGADVTPQETALETAEGDSTATISPLETTGSQVGVQTPQLPAATTSTPAPASTRTHTPQPTQSGLVSRVWKSISHTNFENANVVQGEWQTAMDPDIAQTDFVNYKNRLGMLVTFYDSVIDIAPEDEQGYSQPMDVQMEEVFAIPTNNNTASLDFVCRNNEWISYYDFNISRTDWYLDKYQEDNYEELDSGSTPNSVSGSDWVRLAMRCTGSQITIWLNGVVLTDINDSTPNEVGTWTMSIEPDLDLNETSLYFASHRVYEGTTDTVGEELDQFQLGNVYVTLDRGFQKEGDLYSLGLTVDNRSNQSIDLQANQVYLEAPDGTRFTAATDPPQNALYPPLRFPLTVDSQQAPTGPVYFRNLSADAAGSGLELVVDLSSFRLGIARFQLPSS